MSQLKFAGKPLKGPELIPFVVDGILGNEMVSET